MERKRVDQVLGFDLLEQGLALLDILDVSSPVRRRAARYALGVGTRAAARLPDRHRAKCARCQGAHSPWLGSEAEVRDWCAARGWSVEDALPGTREFCPTCRAAGGA